MDVRAAVAFEAGEPPPIETVQLEGPKEGEVRVEVKARRSANEGFELIAQGESIRSVVVV